MLLALLGSFLIVLSVAGALMTPKLYGVMLDLGVIRFEAESNFWPILISKIWFVGACILCFFGTILGFIFLITAIGTMRGGV